MKNILITALITTFFLLGCNHINVVTNKGLLLASKIAGTYETTVDASNWPFSGETPVRITIAQSNNDENPQIAVLIEGKEEVKELGVVCSIISNVSVSKYNKTAVNGSISSFGELGNIEGVGSDLVVVGEETERSEKFQLSFALDQLGINERIWLSEEQRIGEENLFNSVMNKCNPFASANDETPVEV